MTVAVKNTGELLTKLLPAYYIESRAPMKKFYIELKRK